LTAIIVAVINNWGHASKKADPPKNNMTATPGTVSRTPDAATTPSLVLLPPTTVKFQTKEPLDDGQISVAIERPSTDGLGVNVSVHGAGSFQWKDVPPMSLRQAAIGTTTYLIHILEVDSQQRTAKIMVAKQRK
jgi:hypothetical protein